MSWTPEEQAIIDQAVEDLTQKEPAKVVQSMLREALSKSLNQKNDTHTRERAQKMIEEVLKNTLDSKDDFKEEVESDPNDPCVVHATISIRPVMPIVIPLEEDP